MIRGLQCSSKQKAAGLPKNLVFCLIILTPLAQDSRGMSTLYWPLVVTIIELEPRVTYSPVVPFSWLQRAGGVKP